VCPSGLPTFIHVVLELFEIHVLPKDEEDELQLKKSNKNYNFSYKFRKIWATQFSWAEMLKNEYG
jgi:tRNA splicing ligase